MRCRLNVYLERVVEVLLESLELILSLKPLKHRQSFEFHANFTKTSKVKIRKHLFT